MKCCVQGCHYVRNLGPQRSFHRFPLDPTVRDEWLRVIKRYNCTSWTPGKSTLICSLHFQIEDYNLTYASGRKLLRPHAVPSIFHVPVAERRKVPIWHVIEGGKASGGEREARRVSKEEVEEEKFVFEVLKEDVEESEEMWKEMEKKASDEGMSVMSTKEEQGLSLEVDSEELVEEEMTPQKENPNYFTLPTILSTDWPQCTSDPQQDLTLKHQLLRANRELAEAKKKIITLHQQVRRLKAKVTKLTARVNLNC